MTQEQKKILHDIIAELLNLPKKLFMLIKTHHRL